MIKTDDYFDEWQMSGKDRRAIMLLIDRAEKTTNQGDSIEAKKMYNLIIDIKEILNNGKGIEKS